MRLNGRRQPAPIAISHEAWNQLRKPVTPLAEVPRKLKPLRPKGPGPRSELPQPHTRPDTEAGLQAAAASTPSSMVARLEERVDSMEVRSVQLELGQLKVELKMDRLLELMLAIQGGNDPSKHRRPVTGRVSESSGLR